MVEFLFFLSLFSFRSTGKTASLIYCEFNFYYVLIGHEKKLTIITTDIPPLFFS